MHLKAHIKIQNRRERRRVGRRVRSGERRRRGGIHGFGVRVRRPRGGFVRGVPVSDESFGRGFG